MAQVTDRTVGANPTGFDMRTELNSIIAALVSDNSGSSAPLNTVPYMKWLDTSNATYYYYKERNHDNTAWVTLFRYTVATKVMEAVSNGTDLTTTLALKANSASPTFTGTVVLPSTTSIGTITNTELSYIDGVTSNIQTQLTGKQSTLVSGTNIKTINSSSILGSGNIVVGETAWTANDSRAMTALNAVGTAPIYACRAWVNFNGTGTVAIRASGNVSSITDNGVGEYTVNFTTAMPDVYYSITATSSSQVSASLNVIAAGETLSPRTTTYVRLIAYCFTSGPLVQDPTHVQMAIFR